MVGDITRGSDVFAHRTRLFSSAIVRALLAGVLALALLTWVFWPFEHLDEAMWWGRFHVAELGHGWGWTWPRFMPNPGQLLKPADLVAVLDGTPELRARLDDLDGKLRILGYGAGAAAVAAFVLFYVYGRTLTQVSHIRGASLSTAFWLRLRLYVTFASGDISLPGFPLPKGAEVTHLGVAGTTGTGKTSFYIFVLDQVRGRRQRAIVYDPSGAYVARYYRPGKDVVAHPFFTEFPGWRLSNEARTVTDYAALAKSMVPEDGSGEGGYWSEAARRLAASLFERLHGDSNQTLFEAVQTMALEDLVALVKGLPAAGVMDLTSPKTAASVRATLATKFDAWRYLKDGPFSIRQWVEQEDHDSWLFIMSRPDERDFLRPLVSLWLDCAVRAVMGLAESRTRRMWLALDELPSLQQLPTLRMAMAEGRRYGLCVMIGYQSWPQLIDVYGLNGAGALDAVARTKVVLACGDALTAQHCAEILGRTDELEQKESLTWGISTTRDSGSLQPQRIERWVVTPSELMQLPDRHAYIRLPGPYPVVRIEIPVPPPVLSRSQVQLGHSPLVALHPSERPSPDPVAEAFGFSGRERKRSTTELSDAPKPAIERSRQ